MKAAGGGIPHFIRIGLAYYHHTAQLLADSTARMASADTAVDAKGQHLDLPVKYTPTKAGL